MCQETEKTTQQVPLSLYDYFPENWDDGNGNVVWDNITWDGLEQAVDNSGYGFCFDDNGEYSFYIQGEDGFGEILTPTKFQRECISNEEIQDRVSDRHNLREGGRFVGKFIERVAQHRLICKNVESYIEKITEENLVYLSGTGEDSAEGMVDSIMNHIVHIDHQGFVQQGAVSLSRFKPVEIEVDEDTSQVTNLSLNYTIGFPPEDLGLAELQIWEEDQRESLKLVEDSGLTLVAEGYKTRPEDDLIAASVLVAATKDDGSTERISAIRQNDGDRPEDVICETTDISVRRELNSLISTRRHLPDGSDRRIYLTESEVQECIAAVQERQRSEKALEEISTDIVEEFLGAFDAPGQPSIEKTLASSRMTERLKGYLAINGGNRNVGGRRAESIKNRCFFNEELRDLDRNKLLGNSSLRLVSAEQSDIKDGDIVYGENKKFPANPIVFEIGTPEFNNGNLIQYSIGYELTENGHLQLIVKKNLDSKRNGSSDWITVDSPDERFLAFYNLYKLTGAGVEDDAKVGTGDRGFWLVEDTDEIAPSIGNVTVIIRNLDGQPRVRMMSASAGDYYDIHTPTISQHDNKFHVIERSYPLDQVQTDREAHIDFLIFQCAHDQMYFQSRLNQPFLVAPSPDLSQQNPGERQVIRAAENLRSWIEVKSLAGSKLLIDELQLVQDSLKSRLSDVEETVDGLGVVQAHVLADLWLSQVKYPSTLNNGQRNLSKAHVTNVDYSRDGLVVHVSAGNVVDDKGLTRFVPGFEKNMRLDYWLKITPNGIEVGGNELDTISSEYAGVRGIYEGIAYGLVTEASERGSAAPLNSPVLTMKPQVFAELATASQELCGDSLCVETIYGVDHKGRVNVGGCFLEYTTESGEVRYSTLEEESNGDIFVTEVIEDTGETIKRPPTVEEYLLFRELKDRKNPFGTIKQEKIDETRNKVSEARNEMEKTTESKLINIAEDPEKWLMLYLLLAADDDEDATQLVDKYIEANSNGGRLETMLDRIITGGNAYVDTRQGIFFDRGTIYAVVVPSFDRDMIFVGDYQSRPTQTWEGVKGSKYDLPNRFLSFRATEDGIFAGPDYVKDSSTVLTRDEEERSSFKSLLGRDGGRENGQTEEAFSKKLLGKMIDEGLWDYSSKLINKYARKGLLNGSFNTELGSVVVANLVYRLTGRTVGVSPNGGVVFTSKTVNAEGESIVQRNVASDTQQIFSGIINELLDKLEVKGTFEGAESVYIRG